MPKASIMARGPVGRKLIAAFRRERSKKIVDLLAVAEGAAGDGAPEERHLWPRASGARPITCLVRHRNSSSPSSSSR